MPEAEAYEEHQFRRAISGDVESVRLALCDALEQLNYVVINENPIQAKRNQQKNLLTANILEYKIRLTIGLKSLSPASTLATFDYSVPYLFTKGDRLTLEREGEALIALAAASAKTNLCQSCGVENSGSARFCRVCGTPTSAGALPAEIEVMSLTAEVSSAYWETMVGAVIAGMILLVMLPLIFFGGPKAVKTATIFLLTGLPVGFLILLAGVFRLRSALNRQFDAAQEQPRAQLPRAASFLPPSPFSVTEGTTELMEEKKIPAAARDTGDME
jgi:hypothetical protein